MLSDGFSASAVLEQLLVFSWKQNKTKTTNCSAKSQTHYQLWFPHKLDRVSTVINQLLHIVLLVVVFHQY